MNDTTELLPHIKLRFDIEHPSFEDCYAYGYESALAEVDENNNPFHANSPEYEQWLDGWWDGFYGEKPLYDLGEISHTLPVSNENLASNDHVYHLITSFVSSNFLSNMLKVTGAIAATAVVGYQVFELVA